DRHDIKLVHVKLTDTASAVSRILAEKAAGRLDGGAIDLLWVNGENFAAMKRAGLLQDRPWVTLLPNWQYTDSNALPGILSDFAEPTEGKESPWGRAQLVFSHDSTRLQTPPKSAQELADYIAANPGRFTFPQPPDFIGMSFLKQILIELSDAHPALYQPVSDASFDFDMHKLNIMPVQQDIAGPFDIAVDLGIPAPCVEIDGLALCGFFQLDKSVCAS
ncbi:MAG: ABC transporter substrate-binding protein, partial [Alphaproteobacteria bacterium]|nr:ABC transporter substrate-binding protein [Alphaproteobacteria bacterium]